MEPVRCHPICNTAWPAQRDAVRLQVFSGQTVLRSGGHCTGHSGGWRAGALALAAAGRRVRVGRVVGASAGIVIERSVPVRERNARLDHQLYVGNPQVTPGPILW